MKGFIRIIFVLCSLCLTSSVFAGWGVWSSSSSSSWGGTPVIPPVVYPAVELEMFVNGVSALGNPHQHFDYGEKVEISWKSKNAYRCFMHRQDLGVYNQVVGKNTSRKIVVKNRHNVYIYCNWSQWESWANWNFYSQSVTLFVNPIYPEITELKTSNVFIYPGETAKISWKTRSARSCTMDGVNVARRGNMEVSPNSVKHYRLKCISKTWHTSTKHVAVTVKQNIQNNNTTLMPEFIARANYNFVDYGDKVTISWKNSTEVEQCKTLWDNKIVPATGSKTITPKAGFDWYDIECTYKDWPFPKKQSVPITVK